jgi:hypothetical protein
VSRWQPEAIGLGVTTTHAALAWRMPGQAALSWTCWPVNEAVDLRAAEGGLPAGPLRITLNDDLVRHWVIEAPQGTASLRELRSYAALRFENLFGEAAREWEIEGDWQASGPMVCHAVPKEAAQRLQETSTELKRPIADRLACASRLQTLNPQAPKLKADGSGVWVSVGHAHCTLWWMRQNKTLRVTTLRTETHNPWDRVGQEILRVNAQQADATANSTTATTTTPQVHWASLLPCAKPNHPALHFVRHRDAKATRFAPALQGDAIAVAVVLASRGCV